MVRPKSRDHNIFDEQKQWAHNTICTIHYIMSVLEIDCGK